MKWPTTAEQSAYMKMRQDQNLAICVRNGNENWMLEKLEHTDLSWSRQARRGYRLFDFWNHYLGIAVEVDGPEHNPVYDKIRDDHAYQRSGVVVLHVRNRNEEDARIALDRIASAECWNCRREAMNLKLINNAGCPKPLRPAKARANNSGLTTCADRL